jgi:hypothetical protein
MRFEIGVDVVCGNELIDLRFIYDTGDLPALQVGHRLEFGIELAEGWDDFIVDLTHACWRHDEQGRRLVFNGDTDHGCMENILDMLHACPFVSDITTQKERDL